MDEVISHTHTWHGTVYPKPIVSVYFLILIFTVKLAVSEPLVNGCLLNLGVSSSSHNSSCEGGNWGGFLKKDCCGGALHEYLYALGQHANQTGHIFLNSTDQRNCLATMKSAQGDILDCGIEKLTSGVGGCSNFSVDDVTYRLGDKLRSLQQHCEPLSSDGDWDGSCGSCMKNWDITMKIESDTCKFAVLVSLISSRIEDEIWVQKVNKCLGDQISSDKGERKRKSKTKRGIWILVGGIIGLMLIVVVSMWRCWHRRCKSNVLPIKDESKHAILKEAGCLEFSIKEVYSATDNLSELNFIGEGTAGKVYEGVLSNHQRVAVKQIVNDGYAETFLREVRSLRHVRHPNLVALLGYCENGDDSFLIYELCPNGSLSEWLFGKDKVLSWIQRLEIAIGSAQGLWFLHTYPEGCIVHRDIKPTNILLGTNMEAKLSDFGLSKVIEVGESYASSEVRGTFGYVDPEYQSNCQVNSLGDVYSFGVVLLQILSGKKVINMNMKKPIMLNKMAKTLSRYCSIAQFADSKFNEDYSAEAFELTLELALSCTALRKQRPSMEQVIMKLKEALDMSKRAGSTAPHSSPDWSLESLVSIEVNC